MRRLIPLFIVALAAVSTGCAVATPDSAANGAATATSPADQVAVIQRALQHSASSTVALDATITAAGLVIKMAGKADPAAKVFQMDGTFPQPIGTFAARVIGDAAYLQMGLLGGDKPWKKIDLTRLKPGSSLGRVFDLERQTGIVGGIVSAEEVSDGHYRGFADLHKAAEAAGANTGVRDNMDEVAGLAKNPEAIPFDATIDAEGRLTELSYTVTTTRLGDFVTEMRMSGFGEPVTVTAPPADETEDAAEELYALL